MKRVLHVLATLNCGGAESRLMDIYRHIDRDNLQFDFLIMSTEVQYFENEVYELGGRVFRVTAPRTSLRNHIKDINKILKDEGPFHAVHAHTSFHSGIIMLVSKINGIEHRISHSRTTSSQNIESFRTKIQLILGRLLILVFSTDMAAISEQASMFLYGRNQRIQKRVKIIPNAINLNLYKNIDVNLEEQLRKELSIKEEHLVIGQIGRFEEVKNHELTLEIAEKLLERNICFKIIFVGDGRLLDLYKNRIEQTPLRNHIIFLGIRKDIPVLLRIFDVLLVPSLFEGLGGVAIEAQAAGTHCIASNRVPKAVDMGLGLVDFLALEEPIELWIRKLINSKSKYTSKINYSTILNAFEQNNFTLDASENEFRKLYGLPSERK